jgi:sec-independent protein translocase protein TatB
VFGIGETELAIILIFAFLLFGPDKLPGMGRTIGRMLRQFRDASDSFTEVMQTNIMDPAAEELKKSPKQRRQEPKVDDDADVEEEHKETFAERKARLRAEREAQAAQAQTDAATVVPEASRADDEDADVDADVADAAAPAAEVAAQEKQPAAPSAHDLYAHTARKSSRAQAKEEQAREAAESLTSGEEEE